MMDFRIQNEDLILFEGRFQSINGTQCNILGATLEGLMAGESWMPSLFLLAYQAISQRLGWPQMRKDSLGDATLHRWQLIAVSPIQGQRGQALSVDGVRAQIKYGDDYPTRPGGYYNLELFTEDWFNKYYPSTEAWVRRFSRFVLTTAFAGKLTESAFKLSDLIMQMGNAYARQLQLSEILQLSVIVTDAESSINLGIENFLASFRPIGDIVFESLSESDIEQIDDNPNRPTVPLAGNTTLSAYARRNRVEVTQDPDHPLNFQGCVEDIATGFLCDIQIPTPFITALVPPMLGITDVASLVDRCGPRPSPRLLDMHPDNWDDQDILQIFCAYPARGMWSSRFDKTQGGCLAMWGERDEYRVPRSYSSFTNSSLCLALCGSLVEPSVDPTAEFSVSALRSLQTEVELIKTRLGDSSLYDGDNATLALVVHEIIQRIGSTGSHATIASLLLNIFEGDAPSTQINGDMSEFIKQQLRVHTAMLIALRKQLKLKPALTQAENLTAATVGSLAAEIAKENKHV